VLTEQIDEAAACRGDAPYLEDAAGDATLTYAGLRRSARAWARHLDEAGIPPGARVAVRLPDVFGYACALVSIVAAGRVAVRAGRRVGRDRTRRHLPVHERDHRDAQGHPAA
jgi:acyl-CoA synthetase (AMP-forming)/AMP-acid ligase II